MSDDAVNDDLIRPTAGQLDVWARVAGLGIVVGLIVGLIPPFAFGFAGVGAALLLAVLVITPAVASTLFSRRSLAAAKLERVAGYSTMFDFAGFELRDPRTLEVLRAADVRPTGTLRRSLFRSMLTVKPGTLLAKRLEEDDRDAD